MLVILTPTYSKEVPVMVGSKIKDWAMGMMLKRESMRATATWKQAHFGTVMSGSLLLPHTDSKGHDSGEGDHSLTKLQSYSMQGFCLDDVWGPVHTTQKVTIPPFGTISIHGNTGVWIHCMQVHVLAEPAQGPQLPASMVLTAIHEELHPGFSWVPIFLWNIRSHPIEVPAKAIVGKVIVVLLMETLGGSTNTPRKDGSWRHWISRAWRSGLK